MKSNGSSNEVSNAAGGRRRGKIKNIGRNYKLDRKNENLHGIFDKISKSEKVDSKRLKHYLCARYREGLGARLTKIMD